MGFLRFIMTTFLTLLALAAVLFFILKAYGFEKMWEVTSGPADLGPVAFDTLKKGPKPNQALICPRDLCRDQDRDDTAPVYDLTAGELKDALIQSLQAEEHLTRVDDDSDPLQIRYVQHTPLMRFPDTISVRFMPLGEKQSTIALYGRAQVGYSDMGNNLQRLKHWLARLSEHEA